MSNDQEVEAPSKPSEPTSDSSKAAQDAKLAGASRDHTAGVLRDYEALKESSPSIELHDASSPLDPLAHLTLAITDVLTAHHRLLEAETVALDEAHKHFEAYRQSLGRALEARDTAQLLKQRHNNLSELLVLLQKAARPEDGTNLPTQGPDEPDEVDQAAEADPRQVKLVEPTLPTIDEEYGRDEEDPPSPPTSTMPLSPPPPEYLRNAGHTPGGAVARSKDASPGPLAGPSDGVAVPEADTRLPEQYAEGDIPLKGPLCLTPDPTRDPTPLDLLHKTLQQVEQNPEAAKPAVIQAVEEQEAEEQKEAALKSPLSSDTEKDREDGKSGEDVVPILKTKQSLNFGVPLGSLGHFQRRRSDQQDDFR